MIPHKMNGHFFDIFLNLSEDWLKVKKILEKSGNFGQDVAKNQGKWYMNESLLSWKIGICMDQLSNSQWHTPTKSKL